MPVPLLQENGNVKYLDTAVFVAGEIIYCVDRQSLSSWPDDQRPKNLYLELQETEFFDDSMQLALIGLELGREVEERFMQLLDKESVLQNRYGNLLIDRLLGSVLKANNLLIEQHNQIADNTLYNPISRKWSEESSHKFLYGAICKVLYSWANSIIANLKIFTPELHERFKAQLHLSRLYIPSEDRPLYDQAPQPTEPDNIQTIEWSIEASTLYDIFAQLIKMTLSNGKSPIKRESHTIKHMAKMIHQHFSFAKGNPSLEDIERQLQAMTQSDSAGAKRNKITVEIKCLGSSE